MSLIPEDILPESQFPDAAGPTLEDTIGFDASAPVDPSQELDREALKAMIPLLLPKGPAMVSMVAAGTSFGLTGAARDEYLERLPKNEMLLEGLKMIGFDQALAEVVSKLLASSGGKIDPMQSLIFGGLMIAAAVVFERMASSNTDPAVQAPDLVDAPASDPGSFAAADSLSSFDTFVGGLA
jgi:hypothetical protein